MWVLLALFADIRWASGGQWKFLGEQDGAVVGVFLQLPEYIKCTLPAHTPAADVIE